MTAKSLRKIIQQLLLIFCILQKWKYVQPIFQKNNWYYENQIVLLMISKKQEGTGVTFQFERE